MELTVFLIPPLVGPPLTPPLAPPPPTATFPSVAIVPSGEDGIVAEEFTALALLARAEGEAASRLFLGNWLLEVERDAWHDARNAGDTQAVLVVHVTLVVEHDEEVEEVEENDEAVPGLRFLSW